MTDFLTVFFRDTRDAITDTESLLREYDHKSKPDCLNDALYIFHTLKGDSAFMGLENVAAQAHKAEEAILSLQAEPESEKAPALRESLLGTIKTLKTELHSSESAYRETSPSPDVSSWTDLEHFVRQAAKKYNKKVQLTYDVPDSWETLPSKDAPAAHPFHKIRPVLLHLLRNAIHHGIEAPEHRRALGKDECGTIFVQITSGQPKTLQMIIRDDGRGLNTSLIKTKIIDCGLAEDEHIDSLTDEQIHNFIFLPGFSTSKTTSYLAGRGMGMDIARSIVESTGGTLAFETTPGKSTCFTITLPDNLPSD